MSDITPTTEISIPCGTCGEPIPAVNARGRVRKFCSMYCRGWASRHPGETFPGRMVDRLGVITCLACGKESPLLTLKGRPKRHCSSYCWNWSKNHPGEPFRPQTPRTRKPKAEPAFRRTPARDDCLACGIALQHKNPLRKQRVFCSSRCSSAHYANPGVKIAPVQPAPAACLVCDEPIAQPPAGRRRNFCSMGCIKFARAHPGVKRPAIRRCILCAKEYSNSWMARLETCSERCHRRAKAGWLSADSPPERRRPSRKFRSEPQPPVRVPRPFDPFEKPCIECGTPMLITNPWARKRRFCSSKCTATAWQRKNPEAVRTNMREGRQRRRARLYGIESRGVKRAEWDALAASFNHRCAYCGIDGDMTRDHVVPLFIGGRHEIENILPACLRCNMSKSRLMLAVWIPKRDATEPGWRAMSPLTSERLAALMALQPEAPPSGVRRRTRPRREAA